MKKHFKTSKRWTFCIVTLFFISLYATHFYAQVKTQAKGGKPGKPKVEAVWWNVQLPISDNLVGIEPDFTYDDNEDVVRVTVTRSEKKGIKYFFKFFVYQNDGSTWVSMPRVIFYDWVFNEGDPWGFPFPYNVIQDSDFEILPVEKFMAAPHPLEGYEHIMFSFDIYEDLEDRSLYPIGQRICYSGNAAVKFYVWNSFECDTPDRTEPWYHTVSGRITNPIGEGEAGLFIYWLDENSLRIEVVQQNFQISESYCYEYNIGDKKRPQDFIHESYVPFTGIANLSYTMDFIRNRQ